MAAGPKVPCSNCGGKVPLPVGHSRPKIRCPQCGYYAVVPPELRGTGEPPPDDDLPVIAPLTAAPKPSGRKTSDEQPPTKKSSGAKAERSTKSEPSDGMKPAKVIVRPPSDPREKRPSFEVEDGELGPNLVDGSQDEDDGLPYTVPGDGTKVCVACKGRLPLNAVLCVHCGINQKTKSKEAKAFQPIAQSWEPRLGFSQRLQIFAGLAVIDLFIVLTGDMSAPRGLFFLLIVGGLQAFILGTFQKLSVKRNSKGKATLTSAWRLCFVPFQQTEVDWKASAAVASTATSIIGFIEWFTLVCLTLLFILPGILFYFIVMSPTRYLVTLCDQYGSQDAIIFRTTNYEQAQEICDVVSTATGLTYRRAH